MNAPPFTDTAHAAIRRCFSRIFEVKSAQALAIQYGGSVRPDNAGALLGRPGVDGALIGGASWIADQFLAIIHAAAGATQANRKTA